METIGALSALFERYSQLLAAGDLEGLALLYAYPALIVAPHARLVVQDAAQTRGYFGGAAGRYAQQGIVSTRPTITWSDRPGPGIALAYVTFSNQDAAGNEVGRERYCYELVQVEGEWRISVVTPLLA